MTIGILVGQRIDAALAGLYIAAQLIVTVCAGVLLETVMTFFQVMAVYGTAVDPEAPKIGGFGIGLTVAFDILLGGPLSGASMNPARTFGPALASGYWDNHLVYWIGPIIGGVVAGLVYINFFMSKS